MFEDLVFVPLAIPRNDWNMDFDRESFLKWFDQNKTRDDESYTQAIGNPWNVVWLLNRDKGIRWNPNVLPRQFSHVIFNDLPFRRVQKIYLIEQIMEVQHHRDVSREDDEELGPSSYRCMILNDQPESTLYYRLGQGCEGTLQEEKIFPRLPDHCRWFAHNNYNAHHGSLMPAEGRRKIMLCVWGKVDEKRHLTLIEKSVAQYKPWCIWNAV